MKKGITQMQTNMVLVCMIVMVCLSSCEQPISPNVVAPPSLTAPTGLSAESYNYGEVTLEWESVESAIFYQVFYSTADDSSNVSSLPSIESRQTSLTIDLPVGTQYYFWVEARNNMLVSPYSSSVNVTVKNTISAPTDFRVVSTTPKNIALTWEAAPKATAYEVYWTSDSNVSNVETEASLLVSTQDTSVDHELSTDTEYYFWVRAKVDEVTSDFSDKATVTAMLPAPKGLSVSSDTYGKVSLTWEGVQGATEYEVFYSTTTSPGVRSFLSTDQLILTADLIAGGKYYFWVKAKNSISYSPYSSMVNIEVANTVPTPTKFNVTSTVYGKVSLTWEGIEGVQYEVSYSTANDNSVDVTRLPYTDQTSLTVNLTAGTQYYFWVHAKIGEVTSDYSGEKSVMVANTVPVPTNFNVTSTVYGKVSLGWAGVEGVKYDVFYSTTNNSLNALYYGTTAQTTYVMDLAAGTQYYFWVQATTWAGGYYVTSDYSGEKSVMVANTVPVPTNFKASNFYRKVLLGWTGIEGVEGVKYDVFYSETNDNSVDVTRLPSTDQTSLTVDLTLTAGTQYYFWVKAKIGEVASDFSDVKNVTVANTIPTPTNFTATSNNYGKVTLEWEGVEGVEGVGYQVFYSTYNNGDPSYYPTPHLDSPTTTLTANLPAGIEYYFWVRAKTTVSGEDEWEYDVASDFSDAISVTVKNTLSAPTDFTATSNNYGEVTLEWIRVDEALVYDIHYSTDSNFANATNFPTTETTYVMELTAGESYWFWIDAKAPSIMGDMSSSVNVTVQNTLPVPTGFTATQFPSGLVTLVWEDVSKATEYEVFYFTDSNSASKTSLGSTSLTTISKKLTPHAIYYFWIEAKNSTVKSDLSSVIIATDRDYVIGDRGPGGGIIFHINRDTYYECSDNLGSGEWEDAKSMAKNHRGGGYTDWYLPSKTELYYIYENLRVPKLILDDDTFWSSTEYEYYNNYYVWVRLFENGSDEFRNATADYINVRAIRAFTN